MLTIKNLIEEVKKVTNEYSIQGDIVPTDNLNNTDIFDYRVNNFINISLLKIFKEYLSSAVKNIPIFPIKSLHTDKKVVQHLNEDIVYTYGAEAKSISFQVSNNATIILEKETESGIEIIETINVYENQNFVTIQRKIEGLNSGDKLNIKFSGDYPYLIRNIGVYDIEFEKESDIPLNTEYTEIVLPNEVLRINSIKFEDERGIEIDFGDYLLSANTILVPKKYRGNIKIVYYRLPKKVPVNNKNLDIAIDCPIAVEDCLIYYVASMCMKNYDNQLSIILYNEAELRLAQSSKYTNNHNTKSKIANIRGW